MSAPDAELKKQEEVMGGAEQAKDAADEDVTATLVSACTKRTQAIASFSRGGEDLHRRPPCISVHGCAKTQSTVTPTHHPQCR